MVKMEWGDLGLRVVGGKLSAKGLAKMQDDVDVPEENDEDWEYMIDWDEGIPHCHCCGRFCLHLDAEPHQFIMDDDGLVIGVYTDLDRLFIVNGPGETELDMCRDCLEAEAWPYPLMVSIAVANVDSTQASWTEHWPELLMMQIQSTLEFHGKTWLEFMADVKQDVEAIDALEDVVVSVNLEPPSFRKFIDSFKDGPVEYSVYSTKTGKSEEGVGHLVHPDICGECTSVGLCEDEGRCGLHGHQIGMGPR